MRRVGDGAARIAENALGVAVREVRDRGRVEHADRVCRVHAAVEGVRGVVRGGVGHRLRDRRGQRLPVESRVDVQGPCWRRADAGALVRGAGLRSAARPGLGVRARGRRRHGQAGGSGGDDRDRDRASPSSSTARGRSAGTPRRRSPRRRATRSAREPRARPKSLPIFWETRSARDRGRARVAGRRARGPRPRPFSGTRRAATGRRVSACRARSPLPRGSAAGAAPS